MSKVKFEIFVDDTHFECNFGCSIEGYIERAAPELRKRL